MAAVSAVQAASSFQDTAGDRGCMGVIGVNAFETPNAAQGMKMVSDG
jgi:hypothetical protein